MNGRLLALLGMLLVCATAVFGYGFLTMPAGAVADHEIARESAARAELMAKLQAKITVLEAELTQAKEEAQSARADATRRVALLKSDLAEAKEEVRIAKEDRAKTVAAIDAIQVHGGLVGGHEVDEVRQLKDTIEGNRTNIEAMQRKTLVLTGNVAGLANLLAEARKQRDDLRAENQRLKEAAAGMIFPEDLKLSGVVTNTAREVLVEISIGSDDGVRRGTIFEVLREAMPIGRIEVLHASPHAAVGKELPDFKQADIAKNDRVAAKPD
jgi:hypothetical protein